MKGDFSRLTFRRERQYARVLQQQGKPQLDADWNEQAAIFLHQLQTLSADLVSGVSGWAGAPVGVAGFELSARPGEADNFNIGRGRYYVNGLCCECEQSTNYLEQPLPPAEKPDRDGISLVYLAAWEAVVTPADDHALLEPALSGLQTTLRTQTVWQVRSHRLDAKPDPNSPDLDALKEESHKLHARWHNRRRGLLRARLAGNPEGKAHREEGRFRGPENLLYRVEVHQGGAAGQATFKWSRDNGARLLPLVKLAGRAAQLSAAVRREAALLVPGGWVEITDRSDRLLGRKRKLVQIEKLEAGGQVFFQSEPEAPTGPGLALRPWDQSATPGSRAVAGAEGVSLVEGEQEAHWLDLEDGIQVQFQPGGEPGHDYQSGDYWLIPARTADEGSLLCGSAARPPEGIDIRYAPLGLFAPRLASVLADLRPSFQSMAALQDQVNALSDRVDDLADQFTKLLKG